MFYFINILDTYMMYESKQMYTSFKILEKCTIKIFIFFNFIQKFNFNT